MAPNLVLQFDPGDIQLLAVQYNRGNQQDSTEQDIVDRIAPQVKASLRFVGGDGGDCEHRLRYPAVAAKAVSSDT